MRVGILRIFAFTLGGVATALAAASLFVMVFFDVGKLSTDAVQWMKDRHQRQLRIESVELKLWPRPQLVLRGAHLSERQSGVEFAAFDSASLRLAVVPLLMRQVKVSSADIDGLRLSFVRERDGRLNLYDLLQHEDGAPLEFDLAELHAEHAAFAWRDEPTAGFAGRISEASFNTGPLARTARGEIRLAGRFESEGMGLDARGQMLTTYSFDLDNDLLRFGSVHLALRGQHAGLKDTVSEVRLNDVRFSADSPLNVATSSVVLRRQQGAAPFELSASLPSLKANADGIGSGALTGVLRFTGNRLGGDVGFAASGLASRDGRLSLAGLRLSPTGLHMGEARLGGELSGILSWERATRRVRAEAVSGRLEVGSSDAAAAPRVVGVSGSMDADVADGKLAGRLALKVDETALKGSWSLVQQPAPALAFDLDADRLDMDRYLTAPVKDARPTNGAGLKVDLSAFGKLNVDGVLRVASMKLAGLHLNELRLPVHAGADRLALGPFRTALYGGSLDGNAVLAGGKLAVRGQTQGVSLAALLKEASGHEWLAGQVASSFDLSGSGETWGALKQSLAGNVSLQFKDGAVRGLDLVPALHAWRAAILANRAASLDYRPAESMPLGEVSASLRVEDGKWRNVALQSRNKFKQVSGAGQVDLVGRKLDWQGRITMTSVPPGVPADLKGRPLPVRLTGSFDRLQWRYEPAGAGR